MKKILVAVTGSTPQILTETIYALYKERDWIPDEIHVLTTTHGRDEIKKSLIGVEGQLQKLYDTYGLEGIQFSEDSIHVIKNAEGELLADIKSVEDNDRAANMIVHFIHDLCQDPNNELHVSLAGGRKSMGFYVGYALSLFGRQQDSMSHVLVNHPYEYARDFFFPTKDSQIMTASYKDGDVKHEEQVDAKDAKIWLSDIPFVRMGEGVPNLNLSTGWEYRDAVSLTQTSISDYTVKVVVAEQKLICNDHIEVSLTPQQMAFYAAIAKATKEGKVVTEEPGSYENEACQIQEFAENYIYFQEIMGKDPDEITVDELCGIRKKKNGDDDGIEIFCKMRPAKSRIDHEISKKLGSIATHFGIQGLGDNTEKYYQLSIKPENITII